MKPYADYLEDPLVRAARTTVCVPVYNGADHLQATLDSIASQDDRNLVAVVVDNASTDETAAICQAVTDPRFFYVRNDTNIGAVGNHNKCLALVRTPYAKLLSADDVLLPQTLGRQRAVLDDTDAISLVTCDCIVTGPALEPVSVTQYLPGRLRGDQAVAACVSKIANLIGGPSNTLLRMSAVGDRRFDARYKWLGDLDFHCRVLATGDYCNIGGPGFYYRRHAQTDSQIGCPPAVRRHDEAAFVRRYARTLTPYLRLCYRRARGVLTPAVWR